MSLYYINVSVHRLAAFLWLGDMFFLAVVGAPVLRRVEPPTLRKELRVVGWIAISVLLLTGLGNLHLRGLLMSSVLGSTGFWSSSYGKTLAVKLSAVLVLLVVQAVYDFIYGPRSGRLDPAAVRLARGL